MTYRELLSTVRDLDAEIDLTLLNKDKEMKLIGISRVECCKCHRRFEIEDYGKMFVVEVEDKKIQYNNRKDVRCPVCNSKEIF